MAQYTVEITETRRYIVEAESPEQAKELAHNGQDTGELVDVEFAVDGQSLPLQLVSHKYNQRTGAGSSRRRLPAPHYIGE